MITFLSGTVHAVTTDRLVLVTAGVGRSVLVTPEHALSVRHGQEAEVHTFLVVREDSLTLFGFRTPEERDVFEILQSVSGIGPKLALAVVSVLDPPALRRAVATEDEKALTAVPGIGKKVAARLMLELQGKLPHLPGGASEDGPVATPLPEPDADERTPEQRQVVQALEGLGWKTAQAQKAVDEVAPTLPDAPVATLLKTTLRHLGGRA
ncbi:Holliday junction branch migration protein RuvA [Brevibacterium litoralis]|uniref:Holliday junction branch migration protein RuvA n=1 Tax=Brevibacterium litoralis TaxID=3138935 RepID=UPI0032EAC0AD